MDENIPMRAVIYGRSAAWQPDKDFVADQIAECEAFAIRHRMAVVATYEDHGASGMTHAARPGLNALAIAIASRGTDAVIVRDLDRLTRDSRVLAQILDHARAMKVQIFTVTDRPVPSGRVR